MNIKKATNSQLSTTESKNQTKETTRMGTESQAGRSFGGISAGKGKGENGIKEILKEWGKFVGIKKYKLVVTDQPNWDVKGNYRKWSCQKTYLDMNKGRGITEGSGRC